MNEQLIITTSPHLKHPTTTQMIMLDVLIALSPAAIAAVIIHGWYALLMIVTTVAVAVGAEFIFNLCIKKKETVSDLSAAVTGLILALNLPSTTELWQCAIGAIFAIVVVKCFFGGIGCNFANPAATARVFLVLAFAAAGGGAMAGNPFTGGYVDLVGGATPLPLLGAGTPPSELPTLLEMLLGLRGGAIGEGCIIALLIGGIYLIVKRVIHWEVPTAFIATIFILSWIITGNFVSAIYYILAGGVFIAAFFMITDYSTTPLNTLGKIVFAIGAGLITILIRFFGSYPEGVSFAILIMNIVSPYIEKLCRKRPFGGVKNEN